MIDAALLRPGRLDKRIFIDIPNKQERLDIINVISKTVHFDESVQIESLADETIGLTGADLQGMIYTAHLNAIQHEISLGAHTFSKKQQVEAKIIQGDLDYCFLQEQLSSFVQYKPNIKVETQIKITFAHIKNALETTRPSIDSTTFEKLKRLYQEFQGDIISIPVGSKSKFA